MPPDRQLAELNRALRFAERDMDAVARPLRGHGLSEQDMLLVLETCGVATTASDFSAFQEALAITTSGAVVTWGNQRFTSACDRKRCYTRLHAVCTGARLSFAT